MRTGKGNQDEEEMYGEDEVGLRREGPSSNNSNTNKDGKNVDRASLIRSKHSVTEQRRRSKINERFQILRELIPNSDQKRDTASFLLEVIEYVQYLQEKVQKYEGSYPGWSPEPTKLMPWRNSHWRVQSSANSPQAINNGSGPATAFPGKFEENSITVPPTMLASTPNPVESAATRDIAPKAMDRETGLESKGLPMTMPLQANMPVPVRGAQSAECAATGDALAQRDDLIIEGGTISISSIYSQELLSSLTQALQKAGIDLSHAKISVQIDLGKRANQGLSSEPSIAKDSPYPSSGNQTMIHPRHLSSAEESDQAHKRFKT